MTTQIAVRIPDDLVEFLDQQVSGGAARSRADIVTKALRRERRRQAALHDARIYSEQGDYPEFDEMIADASRQPLEID